MCARIFYLLLAALFVFLVVTVAAFRYLVWWQALLVSEVTFVALVLVGRWLIRRAIRNTVNRIGEAASRGFLDAKSRVLRGATVDVHAVRPADQPANVPSNLRWYEVEATIFPEPAGLWDLTALRLAPERGEEEYEPRDLVLVEEGKPVISVDGRVTGPRRLRFTVGVPPGVRDVRFRYHFEQFGPFRLVPNLGPPPLRAAE